MREQSVSILALISRLGKPAFTIRRHQRIGKRKKKVTEKWTCDIFHSALAPGEILKTTMYKKTFTVRLVSGRRKKEICQMKGSVLTIKHRDFSGKGSGVPCIIARRISK